MSTGYDQTTYIGTKTDKDIATHPGQAVHCSSLVLLDDLHCKAAGYGV